MDLKVGMLWYDDARDRSLADKIARAANYYRIKYGQAPSVCYVAASLAAALPAHTNGLSIKGAPNILPDHFWLGVAWNHE